MYTSDGDNTDVFSLAATRVVWEILRLPWCPEPFMEYSPHLVVALLFQVFISTEQVPEEVDNFWRTCQEQHGLSTSINRFAMQTLRALFHHLRCVHLLVAMERKCGWDTLLCVDTHHYAVGLLAREMRRVSIPLCSCIALRLLRLLNQEEPRWELAAMAFLVEVLECLDLNEWGENLLEIMTKHLKSESKEECHLALRGLVVLSQDPLVVRRQWLKLCWQCGAGESSLLGLAGLWELWQLLPALLCRCLAARVLRERPLASGLHGSRVGLQHWSGVGSAAVHGFIPQTCIPHRPKKCAACLQAWCSY
ncbi:uncharacterized protein LOC131579934 [Poecile atricapillus]|uniref:uncharacterized protein LOC131579934 n=1 Tax=Poecile atricapillus TaxID=48891 RepID=UPI002738B1D2|nr:uncharacterized protein LOC131579934 [Poecile atricapillus]